MLVIAFVVLIATARARRQQLTSHAESIVPPQTTPPVPSDRQRVEGLEQDGDSAWQQRVLALAVELRGSLTSAELHETIARKLPPLIGVDQLWIETSVGGRRKVISSPISSEGPTIHPLLETAGEWATFPLRSADAIVGVIGVPITHRPLAPAARRALASLAPLLGDSLQTAHTIAQLRDLSTIDSVTGCSTRPDGLDRHRVRFRAHSVDDQRRNHDCAAGRGRSGGGARARGRGALPGEGGRPQLHSRGARASGGGDDRAHAAGAAALQGSPQSGATRSAAVPRPRAPLDGFLPGAAGYDRDRCFRC